MLKNIKCFSSIFILYSLFFILYSFIKDNTEDIIFGIIFGMGLIEITIKVWYTYINLNYTEITGG